MLELAPFNALEEPLKARGSVGRVNQASGASMPAISTDMHREPDADEVLCNLLVVSISAS